MQINENKTTTIMKKLAVMMLASLLTAGAFAQTTPTPATTDKKQDMKDIRHDIRDERHDKRERAADVKAGDKAAAKAETKDIHADKKDIKADAKDAKADGVKHPVRRARRQIHRQNHH
jgi:hypothetical protein